MIVCVFWQKAIAHSQEFARALSLSQTHLFVSLSDRQIKRKMFLCLRYRLPLLTLLTTSQYFYCHCFSSKLCLKLSFLHPFFCMYIYYSVVLQLRQRGFLKKNFVHLEVSIYFFIPKEKGTFLLSLNCFLAGITKILEINLLFHCLRN